MARIRPTDSEHGGLLLDDRVEENLNIKRDYTDDTDDA